MRLLHSTSFSVLFDPVRSHVLPLTASGISSAHVQLRIRACEAASLHLCIHYILTVMVLCLNGISISLKRFMNTTLRRDGLLFTFM